jgi:photosystem II stability/assembly factor-like uncharacterized protein
MRVENDYLDQVEAQLVELTERGAHRRRGRGPGGALAAGLAVVLVVAVVVVALGTLHSGGGRGSAAAPSHRRAHVEHSHPGPSPRTTAPHAAGALPSGPAPAGFEPESFTAISELTWWLLGTAPCSTPPCTSIVRTTDGGVSFAGVPAPPAPLTLDASQDGISQLRFADIENGFAYGGALYVTHDGGRTWQALDLGGRVVDLAIAGARSYAIVTPSGGGPDRLMSAFVGQDDWSVVSAAGAVADGLWAQGNDVFVETADRLHLLVSHDQGVTFARYPDPSPGLGCDFQQLVAPVVWADCATGMMSQVLRSTDGGATFQVAGGGRGAPAQGLPNSAAFAVASATTAVVGYQQLYRTGDGGESYQPVGPSGITDWQYLGFTDATHGVALGYAGPESPSNERLYYTTDAGLSYHLVPMP